MAIFLSTNQMVEEAFRIAEPSIKALFSRLIEVPPALCVIVATRFGEQNGQYMIVGELALGESTMWGKNDHRAVATDMAQISAQTGQSCTEVGFSDPHPLAKVERRHRGNIVTDHMIISCACSDQRFGENIASIVAACYLSILQASSTGDDARPKRERPA